MTKYDILKQLVAFTSKLYSEVEKELKAELEKDGFSKLIDKLREDIAAEIIVQEMGLDVNDYIMAAAAADYDLDEPLPFDPYQPEEYNND